MAGSGTAHLRPAGEAVLRIEDLVVEFPVGRSGLKVNAVSSVSIDVLPGETLGLVGESGCGKSTMGKAVMQLVHATSGSVLFEGVELTTLSGPLLREIRPKLQMIFQDPISSLNPRRRVQDIVREGLDIWKIGDKESRPARERRPRNRRHRSRGRGPEAAARVLRRSVPTHLDRACGRHRTEAHHL